MAGAPPAVTPVIPRAFRFWGLTGVARGTVGTGDTPQHRQRGPTLRGDRRLTAPGRPARVPPRRPLAAARGARLLGPRGLPSAHDTRGLGSGRGPREPDPVQRSRHYPLYGRQ